MSRVYTAAIGGVMRSRWSVVGASALWLAACDNPTSAKPEQLVDFVLDFCPQTTATFVASQNDGGVWTRVTLDANGDAIVPTTPRLGLAISGRDRSRVYTSVLFGTREELQSLIGTCPKGVDNRTLHGSVAGLSTEHVADIAMSRSSKGVTLPATTFSLTGLPTEPVDLIAHRENRRLSYDFVPNRLIMRRDVSLATGATMPVLDFSASEAVIPATNTLTTSSSASERDDLIVYFTTANGTHHWLQFSTIPGGIHSVVSVPPSMTRPGDLHELWAFRTENDGSNRSVILFQRNPGDQAVAFGSRLSMPTITTVSTTPSLRTSARLPSQTDYGAYAHVSYRQCLEGDCPNVTNRRFSILVTSGYVNGTPKTWDLEMPDFSSISGFPTDALLSNGVKTYWDVQAANALHLAFYAETATDGTSLKIAERSAMLSGSTSQLRSRNGRSPDSLGMTWVLPREWRRSVVRQGQPK